MMYKSQIFRVVVFLLCFIPMSACSTLPLPISRGVLVQEAVQANRADPVSTPVDPIATSISPGNYDEAIMVGTTRRTYRLVVPKIYSGIPIPMVIFLHGRGGDGRNFEIYCGMTRKAESAGFVVVYPDAMGAPTAWNAGFNHGRVDTIDDVSFIKHLIAAIQLKVAVDPRRIYIGGYSSGGIMSYRLASELSEKVAAFGIMAGTIGAVLPDGKEIQIPNPAHPVSILHIHGLKDTVVPYDGFGSKLAASDYFSAPRSVRFWAEKNGCGTTPRIETAYSGKLIKEIFTGCEGGVDVTLYTLPEGDHAWPVIAAGPDQTSVTASDLMWEYFSAHTLKDPAP